MTDLNEEYRITTSTMKPQHDLDAMKQGRAEWSKVLQWLRDLGKKK